MKTLQLTLALAMVAVLSLSLVSVAGEACCAASGAKAEVKKEVKSCASEKKCDAKDKKCDAEKKCDAKDKKCDTEKKDDAPVASAECKAPETK
jgi:hypothetical protein